VHDVRSVDGLEGVEQLVQEDGDVRLRQRTMVSEEGLERAPRTSSMDSTTLSSSAAQPVGATTCGWTIRRDCSRTKRRTIVAFV